MLPVRSIVAASHAAVNTARRSALPARAVSSAPFFASPARLSDLSDSEVTSKAMQKRFRARERAAAAAAEAERAAKQANQQVTPYQSQVPYNPMMQPPPQSWQQQQQRPQGEPMTFGKMLMHNMISGVAVTLGFILVFAVLRGVVGAEGEPSQTMPPEARYPLAEKVDDEELL